jgi:two-component system LytT family response regulator
MIKVLILDDQKSIAQSIQTLLEKLFPDTFSLIDTVSTIEDAVLFYQKNNYDLLLFDINLGQRMSFDFFKETGKVSAKVIFITGYEKYAISAIKHHCIDYILKPINLAEFKNSIEKAIQLIKKDKNINYAHQFAELQENVLTLKTLDLVRLTKVNEIEYLFADGSYTKVHLVNNETMFIAKNLKDFESKLLDLGFIRTHHSYLVNALKIKSFIKKDGFFVEMHNGDKLKVSTRKKDALLQYIEKFLEI